MAPVLAGKELPSHVRIVPDGLLGYLPFEVLLTEASESQDLRKLPYLIRQFPISYAYAVQLATQSVEMETTLPYVGFAPSYDLDLASIVPAYREGDLQNLPWAKAEVEFAEELFNGKAYYGTAASEAQLLAEDMTPAILHLSMHAILNDEDPLHSRLVFSPTTQFGDLQVHEIYSLPIQSQLVILSACNTGVGPLRSGEGIMSLARAFRYAGSPSVLTSLWVVDDEASYQMHRPFFEQLKAGKRKDEALQSARLAFLESTDKFKAHPFYWASLIQIGNVAPIQIYDTGSILGYVLFAVLILLGLLGFHHFRNSNTDNH